MREWLKHKRLNLGLTQLDIAKEVGIARNYYSEIENGKRTPSPSVAKKLGEVLDFDWTRFWEEDEEQYPKEKTRSGGNA